MRDAWVQAVDAFVRGMLGLAYNTVDGLTEEFDTQSIDIP